jgi:hypothetical protein
VLPLYFGLGDADAIEGIEIDWPSGRRQSETTPGINRTIRIVEPQR